MKELYRLKKDFVLGQTLIDKQKKVPTIYDMNKIEQTELLAAEYVHLCAINTALLYCRPDDRTEVAAAILIRALELATPDLSPERRASLFYMEQ